MNRINIHYGTVYLFIKTKILRNHQYPIRLVAHRIEKLPQRRAADLQRFPKAM